MTSVLVPRPCLLRRQIGLNGPKDLSQALHTCRLFSDQLSVEPVLQVFCGSSLHIEGGRLCGLELLGICVPSGASAPPHGVPHRRAPGPLCVGGDGIEALHMTPQPPDFMVLPERTGRPKGDYMGFCIFLTAFGRHDLVDMHAISPGT